MTGTTAGWEPVPLRARVDLSRGGRWTSLASPVGAGGREWLWHHPAAAVRAARGAAVAGQRFVDAGGGEECLPTVDGEPDHGTVWAMRWRSLLDPEGDDEGAGDALVTTADGLELRRRLDVRDDVALQAEYTVRGLPGRAVLHAVHLLLDLSPQARLELSSRGRPARGLRVGVREEHVAPPSPPPATSPGAAPDAPQRQPPLWPPVVAGRSADRLGPDDGTATAVLVPGCDGALVVDGDYALQLTWSADAGQPTSLLLWRNLCGWPADGPYRSIGVEPLLGAATHLADAERAGAGTAHLDADGRASWTLRLRALRRAASPDRPAGSV